MKFTIDYELFMEMLKGVARKPAHKKKGDKKVRMSACASKVFEESNETVIGSEAQVFADGQCALDRKTLGEVLKTFAGRDQLTIEVNDARIAIDSFSMPVTEVLAHASVPGSYHAIQPHDKKGKQ